MSVLFTRVYIIIVPGRNEQFLVEIPVGMPHPAGNAEFPFALPAESARYPAVGGEKAVGVEVVAGFQDVEKQDFRGVVGQ